MLLHRLLSWIRSKVRGSTLPQDEPGALFSHGERIASGRECQDCGDALHGSPSEDDESGVNREKFGT